MLVDWRVAWAIAKLGPIDGATGRPLVVGGLGNFVCVFGFSQCFSSKKSLGSVPLSPAAGKPVFPVQLGQPTAS